MGQILHRSATTTEAIRRAIQHSQESLRTLSRRHGINPSRCLHGGRREKRLQQRKISLTTKDSSPTKAVARIRSITLGLSDRG